MGWVWTHVGSFDRGCCVELAGGWGGEGRVGIGVGGTVGGRESRQSGEESWSKIGGGYRMLLISGRVVISDVIRAPKVVIVKATRRSHFPSQTTPSTFRPHPPKSTLPRTLSTSRKLLMRNVLHNGPPYALVSRVSRDPAILASYPEAGSNSGSKRCRTGSTTWRYPGVCTTSFLIGKGGF